MGSKRHIYHRLLTVLALTLLLGSATACKNGQFYPFWAKTYALDIWDAPDGPPIYQQGYRDGCESGFKGYGTHYNKVWWSFKQDEKYRNDPVYYQIWKDAYAHCAAYAMSAGQQDLGNYDRMGVFNQ